MSAPPWPRPDAALFLDFDGTLADIAPHPSAVRVMPGLLPLLQRLMDRLDGAVAVVSGRPLEQIDELLSPLRLPAAGVHGVQRRDAAGRRHDAATPPLDDAAHELQRLCEAHAGLRLERKPGALALHYRGADALEDVALEAMAGVASGLPGMAMMHGKKVIELKPSAADKGRAVAAFLAEPPFADRVPWCFGDDVTDEAAFAAVLRAGGIAVKIGEGESIAPHRLAAPTALLQWLAQAEPRLRPPVADAAARGN